MAATRAMRPEDVFLGTYRETGGYLTRGVTLTELMRFWGGDERGLDWAGPRRPFEFLEIVQAAGPVVSQQA